MATKKKGPATKGKRYSEAEKSEILAFIEKQGRGGQTAASKKFGVSPLTLSSWRKKSGGETNVAPAATKGLDVEIATAKWLGKNGFQYEIFQSLSSGSIERRTAKGIEALGLFSGGDYEVVRLGKGGEPVIEITLSKLLELTKTKP